MPSNYYGRMAYANDTWRECGVWVSCENGVRYVKADVIGACAVHRTTAGNTTHYYRWHLTHIPTGRAVADYARVEDARVVAEALVLDRVALNTTSVSRARRIVGEVIGV